jgi:hypothetical protein
VKEGDNLEDLGVNRDNTKIDLKENSWEIVKWINLAQDTGKWEALVKAVMNLRVS